MASGRAPRPMRAPRRAPRSAYYSIVPIGMGQLHGPFETCWSAQSDVPDAITARPTRPIGLNRGMTFAARASTRNVSKYGLEDSFDCKAPSPGAHHDSDDRGGAHI